MGERYVFPHGGPPIQHRTCRKGAGMSPWKRVRIGALCSTLVVAVLASAIPARAQFYEDSRRALDLTPDPLERSPRLLGMGRLTVIGEDPHYALTLWDFGGNPA